MRKEGRGWGNYEWFSLNQDRKASLYSVKDWTEPVIFEPYTSITQRAIGQHWSCAWMNEWKNETACLGPFWEVIFKERDRIPKLIRSMRVGGNRTGAYWSRRLVGVVQRRRVLTPAQEGLMAFSRAKSTMECPRSLSCSFHPWRVGHNVGFFQWSPLNFLSPLNSGNHN